MSLLDQFFREDGSNEPDATYPGAGSGTTPGAQTDTTTAKGDGFNELAATDGGKLALAYGLHVVIGHLADLRHDAGPPPTLRATYMQGEGPWNAIVKAWYAGEQLAIQDLTEATLPGVHFHPGTLSSGVGDAVQGVDTYIPDGITYNKTANTVVKLPEKFATEQQPEKFAGIYECLLTSDYDADGVEVGVPTYSTNPARVCIDGLKRAGFDVENRIDWPSWHAWKEYCAVALTWDDGTESHTIPRFEAHLAFTDSFDRDTFLGVCCLVSCTRWQDDGAKLHFLLPTDTTVQHTFQANNYKSGSLRVVPADIQLSPRHIQAKFLNIFDEFFAEGSAELTRDDLIEAYGDKVSTRALPNMSHSQAQRIIAYQMRLETDYWFFVEIVGAGDSLHILPGDFVSINIGDTDARIDGNYLVIEATDASPESTPDERSFRLQKITGVLYSDSDHHPIQRPFIPPSPPTVDPLVLLAWYAAYKEPGLTDGDRLASITDFSGNERHFLQATPANQMRWDADAGASVNHQPGFYGDGVAYFAECAAFMSSTEAEIFLVVKTADVIGLYGAYKFDGDTDASHIHFSSAIYSSFGSTVRGSYTPSPSSNLTDGLIHQIAVQAGSGNWKMYENGVLKNTQTPSIAWGTGRHLLGASSVNADGSGQSNYFKGHFLEMQIYSSVRTNAQRNAILSDLSARYGIPFSAF